jgi:hypothetical protein
LHDPPGRHVDPGSTLVNRTKGQLVNIPASVSDADMRFQMAGKSWGFFLEF